MISEISRVDVADLLEELCDRFGVDKDNVTEVKIDPHSIRISYFDRENHAEIIVTRPIST